MTKKRWVVKIGSALLTHNGKGRDKSMIAEWVEQIIKLDADEIEVILVSSGAIAEGIGRMAVLSGQIMRRSVQIVLITCLKSQGTKLARRCPIPHFPKHYQSH